MKANMNDTDFYDFLTEYEDGHLFYSADETDEVFDNLEDALDYGESISDDWIGEMNVCEYVCNVKYNEDEFKYERIDECDSELAFTGNYWTLTESGWKEQSDDITTAEAQEIIDNGNYDV